MPNPLAPFVNSVRNRFHEAAVFLTKTEKARGVSPEVPFATMTAVYLGDLAARASIDFLADQIAGQGFYTTMNEEYREKSEGKTAKEIVDEFCEEVGLDEILQASTKYLVGWGNVFWWLGNPSKIEFLQLVPLEIIKNKGVHFGSDGKLERLELEWDRDPKQINGDELIHLAYNTLTAEPLGIGILRTLCTPLNIGDGEQREPFYQIMSKIHSGMANTIYTFGGPNELYSLPGISKEKLQEFIAVYKNAPKRGQRIFINPSSGSKAEVTSIVAEGFRGTEFYVQTLGDEYLIGLQSPISNLLGKSGFKYATAKAAVEVIESRIMALQRFLKRSVEKHLFNRILAQVGLDPKQAQVRLNWGMAEALDYEKLTQILGQLTELLKVVPGVIGTEELRKILRDVAKLPLEKEKQPEAEMVSRVLSKEPIKVMEK
jgi:hypothetical protein